MSAAAVIRNYVCLLKIDELVTPLEFLNFGWTSGAVYQALYRLVKCKVLRRVARGVYVVWGSDQPSNEQIQKVKAARFNKSTCMDPVNAISNFALLTNRSSNQSLSSNDFINREKPLYQPSPVSATNGHSSLFHIINEVAKTLKPYKFHGLSNRKVVLGQTKTGQAILALWKIGKKKCSEAHVNKVLKQLSKNEERELCLSKRFMPGWLGEFFQPNYDAIYSK